MNGDSLLPRCFYRQTPPSLTPCGQTASRKDLQKKLNHSRPALKRFFWLVGCSLGVTLGNLLPVRAMPGVTSAGSGRFAELSSAQSQFTVATLVGRMPGRLRSGSRRLKDAYGMRDVITSQGKQEASSLQGKERKPMSLPKGWYVIGLARDLQEGPQAWRRFGLNLVVWRNHEGRVIAQENRCPHQLAELSLGQRTSVAERRAAKSAAKTAFSLDDFLWREPILAEQSPDEAADQEEQQQFCLQCPLHGLLFNEQGECVYDPKTQKGHAAFRVKTFEAREAGPVIYLKWGEGHYPEPDGLPELENFESVWVAVLSEAGFQWNVENALDNDHVELVHAETFAKQAGPLMVENPQVTFTQESIHWHFENPHFFWQLNFPNRYRNPVNDYHEMTIFYVVVDAEHTLVIIGSHRRFQKFPGNLTHWPGFKQMTQALIQRFYRIIMEEDQRIVRSQQRVAESSPNGDQGALGRVDDELKKRFRRWLHAQPPFEGRLATQPALARGCKKLSVMAEVGTGDF